jgi:replicative DNA helicase
MVGKEQELSVLSYVAQNPGVLWDYEDTLSEIHFEYKQANIIFKILLAIYKKYHKVPTRDELLWRLKNLSSIRSLDSVQRTAIEIAADGIYRRRVTEVTGDFVATFILQRETAKAEELLELIREENDTDKLSDYLFEAQEKFERMQALLSRETNEGMSLPFEPESLVNVEDYVLDGLGGAPIPSGLGKLDYRTRGGFYRGEVQLFIGATGVGKTVLLVSLATEMLRRGLCVVYYALDNTRGDMRQRFYASITGVPLDLETSLTEWATNVSASAMLRSQPLRLVIQHFPANSVTVSDLRKNLGQLKGMLERKYRARGEEFKGIDAVFVDHGNVMESGKNFREMRHNLSRIFHDMSGWAQRDDVPIIAAAQANKDALRQDVVTVENLAEAFSAAWPVKLVGCICQSESEYQNGLARISFPKNTHGPKNWILPVEINYQNYRVYERDDVDGVYPLQSEPKKARANGKQIAADQQIEYGGPTG